MNRRITDAAGHAWPVTGRRCPACRMPADPGLDGQPHPGCIPAPTWRPPLDTAGTFEANAVQALGAEVIGYYHTRWRIAPGGTLPTAPDVPTVAVPPERRLCSDCGLPLPETAGIGITCHVRCWQTRRPAPGTWPTTTASHPRMSLPTEPTPAVAWNPAAHAEPATHRPRPCDGCSRLSTAIIDGRCLACRAPSGTPAPPVPTAGPACSSCAQPLLLNRPDRTVCERCRRTPTTDQGETAT